MEVLLSEFIKICNDSVVAMIPQFLYKYKIGISVLVGVNFRFFENTKG